MTEEGSKKASKEMRLTTSNLHQVLEGLARLFTDKGPVFFALLALIFGTAVNVHARDRYRCIPADGGNTYTVPGTCRSNSDQRRPLTEQEAAEVAQITGSGKPRTRCTAKNGSYSMFVSGDCPSSDDIRTTEYAKKSIQSIQQAQAARSAQVTSLPSSSSSAALTQAPSSNAGGSIRLPLVTTGLMVLGLLALSIGWLFNKFKMGNHQATHTEAPPRRTPAMPNQDMRPANPVNSHNYPTDPSLQKSGYMQQKAEDFLAALGQDKEVPGGLAFRDILQQSNLDYSMGSLDRVDQLLSQVRTQFSPQRESWATQPGADNFSLMLAFYLGAMISRHGNMPIQWKTRQQAVQLMPSDSPIPEASWSTVVGLVGTTACVPLGVIEDALFGDPDVMTCKTYVKRLVAKLPGVSAVDENRRCAQLLDSFFTESEVDGGLAFREGLKNQHLDYSLASLDRLDQFLKSLRHELEPDYTEYVNRPDTQNFLHLVAFYIGMTVARAGKLSVKWLSFAEAKKNIPELEFEFETTSVCLLAGRFYFPLGLVTEILIQPGPKRTVPDWAKEILKTAPPPLQAILQSSLHFELAAPIDAQWALAVHKAGFMAAWCMFAVQGGASGSPIVFVPGDADQETFVDFGFHETAESALKAADDQMEVNSSGAPFQIMCFDGYANLHTGRTDALTIDLRIYAGGQFAKYSGFSMQVVCPYRHANDPRGFAIYSPKLLECSDAAAMHGAISKHFCLGIEEFKAAEFGWKKYLDESV